MFNMYKEMFPNHNVSYESYRTIFNHNFNLAFGYPRSDTCSTCDEHHATMKSLSSKLKVELDQEVIIDLQKQIKELEVKNEVHLRKAKSFYERKKEARNRSRIAKNTEAISMDFQKNLPCPNITTNIVYYKRQLSLYSFDIHQLSDNKVFFYVYPQTEGKKGANEVVSFLDHYVNNFLSTEVKNLEIFSDSCAGQNKNYTVFRYLYYMVHDKKRFDSIKVTFPVKGHSYLECDKDMGLVNTKSRVEVPSDWVTVFESSRVKPEPFTVIKDVSEENLIQDWDTFLTPLFAKKCSFETRPIKEMRIDRLQNHQLVEHRPTYNGYWITSKMKNKTSEQNRKKLPVLNADEFLHPQQAYEGLLPVKKEKFNDLQQLKKFCSFEAQVYYENLPVQE